jgi:hypothetical protein
MHDPRIVSAYLHTLTKQLDSHKIFDKVKILQQKEPHQWEDVDYQTYKKLDAIITESMLHAERTVGAR